MSGEVIANGDGSVTVKYSISETGNSGVSFARVVAVKNNAGIPRLQSSGIIDAVAVGKDVVISPNLVGMGTSYTFPVGSLDFFTPYFFYCACRDSQGWFNYPPGSLTSILSPGSVSGTPIYNNNGRVFDPTPPGIHIHKVWAIPSPTTTTLRVTYSLYESGNSGIASSRIMASTSDITRDTVLDPTSVGSHVANVAIPGADVNVTLANIDLTGLSPWETYRVFASAVDGQGLYDNGASNAGSTVAISVVIGNNSGRTWDDSVPSINVVNVSFVNPTVNNSLRVEVKIVYSGSSGIQSATVFLREACVDDSTDPKVSQYDIISETAGGIRQHVLTNTSTTYDNSIVCFFDLKEATSYRVFVAILDNQGNYNSSPATIGSIGEIVRVPKLVSGVSIPNGGVTYSLNPYFEYTNATVFENTNTQVSIVSGTKVFTHAASCDVYLVLFPSNDFMLNNIEYNNIPMYSFVRTPGISYELKRLPEDVTKP